MKAKAKILLSGKIKTTKSTMASALMLSPRRTPVGATEATALPIYISSGRTPADDESIKVYRTDGSMSIEPNRWLLERYTGRDVEENIKRIELQTDSEFLDDIVLIDTPGTNSCGDFSKRHDTLALAELQNADLRIHLTRDVSELMRLNTTPHQPCLVAQVYKDTHVLQDTASNDPFAPVKKHWLNLERASKDLNLRSYFCAPLIELGAKLLSDIHYERILALAGESSAQAFTRLLSPRDCLGSEFSGVPLALAERLSLLAEMSETLLLSPCESKKSAWPFFRIALFFSRHYRIKDDKNELRNKLSEFSGIPQLRQDILNYLGEVPQRRSYRALLNSVKSLIQKNSHELQNIRQKTSALENALANAEGAICEITNASQPVLEFLKSESSKRSGQQLLYEKALTYLQSPSPFEDGEAKRRLLQRLVKSDCGIAFAVRQQSIEALQIKPNKKRIKK